MGAAVEIRESTTLGVDLAAQPLNTAACELEWSGGWARVAELAAPLDDDGIVALVRGADRAGIDAPFGWPDEFVEAVSAHAAGRPWPGRGSEQGAYRARLALRETDRFASREGRRPLSVSTDRIAVPAMRCAALLDCLAAEGEPVDRSGAGRVVEVYPAGALARWGLASTRYKRAANLEGLKRLLAALRERAPWLELGAGAHRRLESEHDCFDALVCALVARAAALGLTDPPPPELRGRARREGWIHLPHAGSLDALAG